MERVWNLKNTTLKLVVEGGELKISGYEESVSPLSDLARIGEKRIAAECAIEVIFSEARDNYFRTDAVRTYTKYPLADPPAEYLAKARAHDWNLSSQGYGKQAWPVIFSGTTNEIDKLLVLKMLNCMGSPYREDTILTASSFDEEVFQDKVCELLCKERESDILDPGELWVFCTCFRRWLDRDVISYDRLKSLLFQHEQSDPNLFRAKRALNYIVCWDWRDLPFPEEMPRTWMMRQKSK